MKETQDGLRRTTQISEFVDYKHKLTKFLKQLGMCLKHVLTTEEIHTIKEGKVT